MTSSPPSPAENLHYYVYKNGVGNCWNGFTWATHLGGGAHLCLGNWHELHPLHKDADPFDSFEFLKRKKSPFNTDYDHLRVAAHAKHRDQFVLLVFGRQSLRFWQVCGDYQTHTESSPLWSVAAGLWAEDGRMHRETFRGETPAEGTPKGPPQSFFTLPVKLLGSIPRSSLYTTLDSLAVYQSLNRGTCRPVWRITGSKARIPAAIQTAPLPDEYIHGDSGKETSYAAFVRYALNDALWRSNSAQWASLPRLSALPNLDYSALVLATMNPILVETAALAFVQDLRLTPDIGVGKGKDVVDIRARAVGADGRVDSKVAKAAIARLDTEGISISKGVRDKLGDGTLDIQCKAGEGETVPDGVLYFGNQPDKASAQAAKLKAPSSQVLVQQLGALKASGGWEHLPRFIAMQAAILRGDWTPEDSTTASPAAGGASR